MLILNSVTPAKTPDFGHLIRRYYLPRLPSNKSARILDFGCGSGRVIDLLNGYGYGEVQGYDRGEDDVRGASEQARRRIRVGESYEDFLRENGSWDAIILKDVLYYFDPSGGELLLKKLRERLSPGAPLLVVVYNGACFSAPYVQFKDHGIRQVYTERSLRLQLEAAGFRLVALEGLRPAVTGVRSFLHQLASRFWHGACRTFYWLERGANSENPSTFETAILATVVAR
jgi:SAM-dependent methyltransferase